MALAHGRTAPSPGHARWIALLLGGGLVAACGGGSSGSAGDAPGSPAGGGLDGRPANGSCVAPEKTGAGSTRIALEDAFPALPDLDQPLALLQAPGDTSRWFAVEKGGRVRVFGNAPGVAAFEPDLIDLGARVDASQFESGLLGMAFHPDYAANGEVFLSYTAPGLVSVVSRFKSHDGGLSLDPGSEAVVLRVRQDFVNHNGGHIGFGPDGFLYVGLGDGGSGGDPLGRAQDTTNLLGAMLRLDVDGGTPYAIPPDNPFAGNPRCAADHSNPLPCPELYAWGLRNPWRWSFDRATDALWAGDVGQNAREEVDRIERGGNYGWDCREGSLVFGEPAASCTTAAGLIDPVHEYGRGRGDVSITGGHVYRGSALPALVGRYVFGDFGSGRIWALAPDGGGGFVAEELHDGPDNALASFAEGHDGELYTVNVGSGRIMRLVDGGGAASAPAPVADQLSATGCVDPAAPREPAEGLIPYAVQAPFWSDGAVKERWLAVPDGATVSVDAAGDFHFPPGTVLMKHFRLDDRLVETRLFMRHPDGEWAGYSYEWNEAATEALRVQGGKVAQIDGQAWVFPSGGECLACHTEAAGFSLGLEVAQLNAEFRYSTTGRSANQLRTLDAIGLFDSPLGDTAVQPVLADPEDTLASLADRSRAWLHTNCAQCHRPGLQVPVDLDLRFDMALELTGACNLPPLAGSLGLTDARIIAPGDPDRSVLLERVSRRDAHGMPPLASKLVDTTGAALLRDWIASLDGCR